MTLFFIGIGGIGMSGLAKIALEQGQAVFGSDLKPSPITSELEKMGATIFYCHRAEHIQPNMEVVYSTAVKEENIELQAAKKHGCKLWHRSEWLESIMQGKKVLAVSGTHGKTTTSALLTESLQSLEPSYAIGGILQSTQTNGAWNTSPFFVIEADESDGSFTRYHPQAAILTNIESEHLEHHGSFESLLESYQTFIQQVKGPVIYWGDDPYLPSLVKEGVSYGFSKKCDVYITNFSQNGWQIQFDLNTPWGQFQKVMCSAIGKYNALNAASVWAMGLHVGLDEELLREGFKQFLGVKKRLEVVEGVGGTLFLRDYAHHPTEIKVTLEALRAANPEKRILALFQPHRYSRTLQCRGLYGGIFDPVNAAVITDIFSAGESPIEGVTPKTVLEELSKNAQYLPRAELTDFIAGNLFEYDLVVTLGAGDIHNALDAI